MDSEPLVSIVLPTYNRQRYLREAVESVLAQTYTRWELIVVDDGSTDGTAEYVRGVQDPRVRFIREEHCGNPARVRNWGISRAAGEYVAFLDSDDLWRPKKLELQLQDLAVHPECEWSYTHCDRIGPRGESLPFPRARRPRSDRGWIAGKVVTVEAVVVTPSVIVTRRLARELGGFDETFLFFEDYEFWARCALASPVTVVPIELVLVRDHSGSNTKGRLEVHEYWVRLAEKIAGLTGDYRLKAVCRTQCARILVRLASRYRWSGEYRKARETLRRAFGYRSLLPEVWVGVLKTGLRPLTPALLLRAYQGLRATLDRRGPA